jgi:hypothetical protein
MRVEKPMKGNAFYSYLLRKNLRDIGIHILIAAVFSFIIYQRYANPWYVIIFIFGAVFIDLDHLLDYLIVFKNKFDLKDFLTCMQVKSGRSYILLHSWEVILLLGFLGWAMAADGILILSLSLGIHLFVDTIQRQNPLAYFFLYRMIKKFDIKVIFPESRIYFEE